MKSLVIKKANHPRIVITTGLMLVSIFVIIAFALEAYGAPPSARPKAPNRLLRSGRKPTNILIRANVIRIRKSTKKLRENMRKPSKQIPAMPKPTAIWGTVIASRASLIKQ